MLTEVLIYTLFNINELLLWSLTFLDYNPHPYAYAIIKMLITALTKANSWLINVSCSGRVTTLFYLEREKKIIILNIHIIFYTLCLLNIKYNIR